MGLGGGAKNGAGPQLTDLPVRQYVDVDGVRISYRQAGAGPDLVLLHGLAGNARTWERQFEAFADQFRITAWDAPGYGESNLVATEVEAYADALTAFTEALGIDRFILLGHSMGGIVAGNAAGRYADRVRGLILSCTMLGRKQTKGAPLGKKYLARLTQLDKLAPMEYGRARAKSMTAPDCDPAILEHFAGIAAETRKDGLEAAARVISEADNEPAFAGLSMPVLVLAGDIDQTVTKDFTEEMIAAVPETVPALQAHYLPGVAHAPYMEDADAYNAVLSDFLMTLR